MSLHSIYNDVHMIRDDCHMAYNGGSMIRNIFQLSMVQFYFHFYIYLFNLYNLYLYYIDAGTFFQVETWGKTILRF